MYAKGVMKLINGEKVKKRKIGHKEETGCVTAILSFISHDVEW